MNIFLSLGTSELDLILQVGILTRAEWKSRITSLILMSMLLLMLPRTDLSFWVESTHCWVMLSFSSTNRIKIFSSGLLLIHSQPNLYFSFRLPLIRVKDLALGPAALPEVHIGPLLMPLKVLVDGIPALQHADHTTQLYVILKLAAGELNPNIRTKNKHIKFCSKRKNYLVSKISPKPLVYNLKYLCMLY